MTTRGPNKSKKKEKYAGNNLSSTVYKHGEPAWVKLDLWPWWPAKVIPPEECPILEASSRPNLACVYFPVENRYEVIYDKSKIQPWKPQTNKTLITKTKGKIKQDGSMLVLFNKVLQLLTDECETDSTTSKKSCEQQFPEENSSKTRFTTAATLVHHSSLLSQMEMRSEMPSSGRNSKMKKGGPPAGVFIPSPGSALNSSPIKLAMSFNNRPVFVDSCSRLFDKDKEVPQGKVERKEENSTSEIKHEEIDSSLETRNSTKRSRSSPTDNLSSVRSKSQRCLYSESYQLNPTLPWDHNILEDSCDNNDDSVLESVHLSQPDIENTLDDDVEDTPDDDDNDDDSGDDLPEILSSVTKEPIKKGSLMWVKHRKFPFWPAIVRRCYFKRKVLQKLTLVFIGKDSDASPRSDIITMAYNKNSMLLFGNADTERHAKLKEEGLKWQAGNKCFANVLSQVEDFLMKQCLGVVDCPFKFFADDILQGEMAPTYFANAGDEPIPTPPPVQSSEETEQEGSMEEEEEVSTGAEVEEHEVPSHTFKKIQSVVNRRKQRGDRILAIIRTPRLKKYLTGIYHGSRQSWRHKQYMEMDTKIKLALQYSGFGPISDEDQQLELVQILAGYLSDVTKKKMPDTAYIFGVWMPEAIIEAIHIVSKKVKIAAEEIYMRGPQWLKEEMALEHKRLVKNGKNIDPEDALKYQRQIDRLMQKLKDSDAASLGGAS